MRRNTGFTAIELMVVIAIVAILAALALPSFAQLIKRWQWNQGANALTDSIYFARSEAVKWGGGVRIVKLPDSGGCVSDPDASDWSCGWQVVLTTIPSGAVGVPTDGVLKRVPANDKNYIMVQGGSSLDLNGWGNPTAGFSVNVQHKRADSDPSLDQQLCLSSGGRLRKAATCP